MQFFLYLIWSQLLEYTDADVFLLAEVTGN